MELRELPFSLPLSLSPHIPKRQIVLSSMGYVNELSEVTRVIQKNRSLLQFWRQGSSRVTAMEAPLSFSLSLSLSFAPGCVLVALCSLRSIHLYMLISWIECQHMYAFTCLLTLCWPSRLSSLSLSLSSYVKVYVTPLCLVWTLCSLSLNCHLSSILYSC